MLFVVSGPSAVGKSTVVESVLSRDPDFYRLVTCTSRAPRSTEIHGKDYFFFSKDEFERRIGNNEFVEYAQVYGNYYGSLRSVVEESIQGSRVPILVVSLDGYEKMRAEFGRDKVQGIFINPPSMRELEARIRNRKEDSPEAIEKRLSLALQEMTHANLYDIQVTNCDIEQTASEIVEYIHEAIRNENN